MVICLNLTQGLVFKCFETKVCHILSHNGGSLNEKKGKKSPWPSHQWPISTSVVIVSIMKCSTVRKKEIPVVTVFHIAIHRRPEALYPEPHTTAVFQPSRNTKQTQNNGQTTGDSKERVRRKKEDKKKVCERARGEMTATGWQSKYTSHLLIFSHFSSLMLRK